MPDDRQERTPAPGAGPPLDGSYLVLDAPGSAELRVERSRFLAEAAPAADEETARAVLARAQRKHHDARHVCWAWRLGAGAARRELRHDAGEPAGTAGEPILGALRHADLTDAVVTVARWFGGVKLGPAGLGRAYGAAAAAALAAAPRRTVVPGAGYRLRFAYPQENIIAHLLERHAGQVLAREYGLRVDWRIWLPEATRTAFVAALTEATAGDVSLDDDTGAGA